MTPGTKWCGPGNIAKKPSDLGSHKKVDECCKSHDQCPGAIPPGGTRHNLTNKSIFARSSCKCDQSLHECLRSVHSITAIKSGLWFYDIIGMKCYKKEYPGWLKSKCIEYVFNTSAERRYQWFDVPNYYTKHITDL